MIEGIVVLDEETVIGTFVACDKFKDGTDELRVQWEAGLRVGYVLQHAFEHNIPVRLMPVIPTTE